MMDLQPAVSVQVGADSKEPAVTLTAPSVPDPLSLKPCLFNSELVESHAVSVTNTDSMPTLPSSPAEACLAKLATTSPTTSTAEGTVVDKSPTTSDIASASDSLASTGTSLAESTTTTITTITMAAEAIESSSPPPAFVALSVDPFQKGHSPAVLRFKGISVTLENNSVWKQFHSYGTEMILTKSGRRMFPYCRYRLSGLNPSQRYSLVLSIVPADQHKYRWNTKKWEVIGAAEYQAQGLIRAFPHQNSPCLGSEWMNTLVSFYKLKLTNNMSDQEGHMILHSMHRYIPRLHVIPVLDGDGPTADQPVIKGPESMTFTFPQTEFVTVTTYQNPWIIQLKINHNPFAKGFREEGIHPRLFKPKLGDSPGTKEAQSPVTKPAEDDDDDDGGAMEISMEKTPVACTNTSPLPTPLCDTPEPHEAQPEAARTQDPVVPVPEEAMEVVPTERSPPTGPPSPTGPPKRPRGRPRKRLSLGMSPSAGAGAGPGPGPLHAVETRSSKAPVVPEDSDEDYTTTPASSRKRKRPNKKWGNSRGRADGRPGGAAVASPAVAVAGPAQPESDDVEGLLFVSFTSKVVVVVVVFVFSSCCSMFCVFPLATGGSWAPPGRPGSRERQVLLSSGLSRVFKGHAGSNRRSSAPPPPRLARTWQHHPPLPDSWRSRVCVADGEDQRPDEDQGLEGQVHQAQQRVLRSARWLSEGPVGLLQQHAGRVPGERGAADQRAGRRLLRQHRGPGGVPAPREELQLREDAGQRAEAPQPGGSGAAAAVATPKAPMRANRPCPLSMKPLLYSVLTSPAPPLKMDRPAAPKAKSPRPKPATPKAGPDAAKSLVAQAGVKALPISLWFPADKTSPAPASHGSQATSSSSSSSNRAVPALKMSPGWGLLQAHLQGKGLSKLQLRMLGMEETLEHQGVVRTSLTHERLDFALSALLTATMKHKQPSPPAQYTSASGPACGQVYCRLGCVCSSLARVNRGPLHCRRPDCMLGCDCFKRKIVKQLLGSEDEKPPESQSNPLYAVKSLQHEVQPSPGSHWDRIWHKELAPPDPEPLYAPKSLDSMCYTSRRPVYQHVQPIQEKDKDPVYKYLESLMTCARIREFRTSMKNPSKDTDSAKAPVALKGTAPAPVLLPQPKKACVPARKFPNIILTFKNTGKNCAVDNDPLDAQQIEILSECHWDDDRKLILGALCQRMKRGNLAIPFCAGPYHVSLIAKILRPMANGSTISYKMRICRLKAASEDEEDADDTSDEEEVDENDSDDGEIHSSGKEQEEEEEEEEEEEVKKQASREEALMEDPCSPETEQMGVTPFLSRVLPAGILQARRKPAGSNTVGLVQVNGKSYPQACLMLGHVGSLHPANRLAAYVTGRLSGANRPQKTPVAPAQKTPIPRIPPRPAPVVKEEPKTKAKAVTESDVPAAPPAPRPVTTFRTRGLGSTAPPCSTSFSSPVSITVSRSLKEPSFLAERGTYSFRICPPAANQGPAAAAAASGPARHPAGVSLPGGFTLIQLPKHGANGALALPVDPERFPSAADRGEAPVKIEVCPDNDADVGAHAAAEDQSGAGVLEAGSSLPKLECDEKMQSGDSDDSLRHEPKMEDRAAEDEESGRGSSDSDREEVGDLKEEGGLVDVETVEDVPVDVETVEDMTQTIDELRKSVGASSRSLWDSSEESGSSMESKSMPTQPPAFAVEEEEEEEEMEEEPTDLATGHRRRQHKVLERLRRMEQRDLFIKLQTLLRTDPKAPKLRLLSQAQTEIKTLVETSKALEKQKKKLCEMQKLYVRRISCLAGKPEDLIRHKLKEVYERKQLLNGQKKGPFPLNKSPQLGGRGHAPPPMRPQAPGMAPPPGPSHTPPWPPRPRGPVAIAPFPSATPPARGSPPRWQPKDLTQGPRDQVTGPHAREKKPKEKAPPKGALVAMAPEPSDGPEMTLPLIRTKTGRIILPSSLKPLGQGFYTITIMEPDKEKASSSVEPGEVVLPTPSDPNASTDQASKQDGETGEEEPDSSSPTGDEATTPPKPVSLGSRKSMSPLVEIARLNKSISTSSTSQSLLLRNDGGGGGGGGARESNGTSRLSFSPCSLVYVPLVQDPAKDGSPGAGEAGPSVPRRGRGRPRKHPLVPAANQAADDAALAESMEAGEGGSPDKTEEEGDSPVLVKRGRGRPPKKRPIEENDRYGGSPPAKAREATPKSQGRGRPPREVWRSPDKARSTGTVCSPDMDQEGGTGSGKRPLTRGALGKDFPSAKRRSWIDVEKELGLD
ncbi:uncharacterized protein magl [Gadus chalcogrammus]|uniref:uncharacterized protein magl n=1 Tax=Gadus chalcogrammus TaxID=1042646 RepID=UPI0024C4C5D5|nr:uncharacterized protein magl [Gadus chalcogrammus]